ncbi:MAG: radical SAM protein [Chitinivibrionales bacterium]|nr:radical SAM protein [Chitinivibrionales bacterium]
MKTNVYNHLFGPVFSRRLGRSLGVELISHKSCTFNCVYCECGETVTLTRQLKEYVALSSILAELERFIAGDPAVDVITFTAAGEPTLNSVLGELIHSLKEKYPRYKTAVLTNSTLLHHPEVRAAIMACDYVLPTCNAISESVFNRINRPAEGVIVRDVLDGLAAFSQEYHGTLWIELFIVPGINDTKDELQLLKNYFSALRFNRIQLNSLDRPSACSWVESVPVDQLLQIARFFHPLPVEIITRGFTPASEHTTVQSVNGLIAAIKRRPLTIEEIASFLMVTVNEALATIESLIDQNVIKKQTIANTTFYKMNELHP